MARIPAAVSRRALIWFAAAFYFWWCRLAVKKSKAKKDPNKPKRPPSAFFVFMDTFRKEYREKHPNIKQVSMIIIVYLVIANSYLQTQEPGVIEAEFAVYDMSHKFKKVFGMRKPAPPILRRQI
ncbi:HMG1/2-like protein [Hordeum vulgare]|nr:HMG1/2-like protein [Hordeum vulgare]